MSRILQIEPGRVRSDRALANPAGFDDENSAAIQGSSYARPLATLFDPSGIVQAFEYASFKPGRTLSGPAFQPGPRPAAAT